MKVPRDVLFKHTFIKVGGGKILIVFLYVDEQYDHMFVEFKNSIMHQFRMTDLEK